VTAAALLLLLSTGFAAGLVGSLFGLGGGILMVPMLVLVLEVPIHNAVATSLLCVIATSSAAASKFVAQGVANVRLGMTLEILTVIGGMIGGLVAGFLPGRVLVFLFACAMSVMAIPMARGGQEHEPTPERSEDDAETTPFTHQLDSHYFDASRQNEVHYRVRRLPVAMSVSGLAGLLSGLLGVGGGILKVPVLVTYCNVPIKAAAATSNFMIGVTAVASAFVYYGRGEIAPLVTAASVLGVFAGSRTGSLLAGRVHDRHLRKGFALLMILVAAQLFWKSIGGEIS